MNAIITHLEHLFQAVSQAVLTKGPEQSTFLGQNAKGDQVKWFDLAADQAVARYLAEQFPEPVQLLSEEGEPRTFGQGRPRFTLVLDPVDGSENFARGLPPSGMAVAVMPYGQPVGVETVQAALVGNLVTAEIWSAERGRGAWRDGQPVRTSAVTTLNQAFVNVDLNRALLSPQMNSLLAQAHGVRSCGAATLDLVRVAGGIFDAHLDVRGLLTPENFLAPSLIISEAGGIISDPHGNPLPAIASLTERFSLIAAGTPQLHRALIEWLQG